MKKITAVLITRNEERNIREALESVQWADEIVVVDAMSEDRTMEIAREYTDKVFRRPWPGYVEQKNHAVSLADNDWIFSIDADERVSDLLKKEIEHWRRSDEPSAHGFFIPRKSYFLGRWIKHTSWYPDEKLRLYHRNHGRWEGGRVHESVMLSEPADRFKGELLHYSYRNISDYIMRLEKYSSLAAEDHFERGKQASFLTLILNPFFNFIKCYFLKQGFRDGFPGLIISLLSAISAFFKYVKLWELRYSQKAAPLESVRQLRILFIDTEKVWRGGQDQLLSLLQGMRKFGQHISLVTHKDSPLEQRARQEGITVYPIQVRSEIGLFAFFRFYRLFRTTRADIIHYNTPRPIFLGTLASKILRVPVRIISRRVNYPLRNNPFSRFKYKWGIDRIIAVSDSIKETLAGQGINRNIIDTVYEGLDIERFDAIPPAQVSFRRDNEFVFGTLAFLSAEKGHQFLVRAAEIVCRQYPQARFVLAGEGPLRPSLEEQVRQLQLQDKVLFAGFREDAEAIMKTFDAFILPSLSEGFPTVILYAMAASLPVIASRVGGIPEMVQAEVTGLLPEAAQAKSLAEAACRFLENPTWARSLGTAGRKRMENVFNLDKKTMETLTIYRQAFQTNAHPLRLSDHPPAANSAAARSSATASDRPLT